MCCRAAPARSFTASSRVSTPARFTAFAPTARGARTRACASTRTNCCSTLTPWRSTGRSGCMRAFLRPRRWTADPSRPRPWRLRRTSPRHQRRRVPWPDTILYELHVRGFTRALDSVPEALRGTFAGLAHPAALAHLKRLGVTTLELMPCAAWIDERHLHAAGLTNYWGYNPVALMAPEPRLAPGGWREVRESVAALAGGRLRSADRRRAQPYRRERQGRPDARPARARQRGVLPPRSRRPRPLYRRRRLRQHLAARSSRDAAPCDGRPARLGALRRSGRLPLRPRHHARPPRRRLRPARAPARGHRAGPACCAISS